MLWLLACFDMDPTLKIVSVVDEECPDGDDMEGLLEATEDPVGCGYRITAWSTDGAARVTLDLPIFADAAAGSDAAATYVLPDDAVRLDAERGCNLDADVCEDDSESASVDTEWSASFGTIEAGVTAEDDGTATADIIGTDLMFEGEDTGAFSYSFEWSGVVLSFE